MSQVTQNTSHRAYRPRRSCLAVPGSSSRFIDKARSLDCDEVFLDLEDAVAPAAKAAARATVVEALNTGEWPSASAGAGSVGAGTGTAERAGAAAKAGPGGGGKLRAVRVNDAATAWAHHDVIDVVEGAAANLDVIVLPKVTGPGHVIWLDLLLTQLEQDLGQPVGRIGIEAQIEDAAGLAAVDAIAAASPRLEALIFGPADFMASLGMRSLAVGVPPAGYPGDAFYYPLMRILVAARAHGLQAIDGPYAKIADTEGLARSATGVAALGFDGKWVVHPGQIDPVNRAFTPGQDEYDRAELILEAYRHHTTHEQRGAAMLDGEMIDEATSKLAQATAVKGRAAGLPRTKHFRPS